MKIVITVLILCSVFAAPSQEVGEPPQLVTPRAYAPIVAHTARWATLYSIEGICTDAEYIDGILYVSCQDGRVLRNGTEWASVPVNSLGESGLNGMATDGARLFLSYVSPDSRLKVGAMTPKGSFRQITDLGSATSLRHVSAGIAFKELSALLVGVGDMESPLLAQQTNAPNGKIFSVDAATGDAKIAYIGFRNPWTINKVNGVIYVGDYGETKFEEANLLSGKNYGWPCYEANERRLYDCGYGDNVAPEAVKPYFSYDRSVGRGIAGIADIDGLAFADFNGEVRSMPDKRPIKKFAGFIVRMKQTTNGVVVLSYDNGKTTVSAYK